MPLELSIAVRPGKSGACTVSFSAPYWLKNDSSIPLRVYDAGSYGATLQGFAKAKHVVESVAHSAHELPFSLGVDGSSVRVGVPPISGSSVKSSDAGSRAYTQLVDESASLNCAGAPPGLIRYLGLEPPGQRGLEATGPQQLSKAFSVAAIGSDGALEVGFGDGSVAEVSVQISRAKTPRFLAVPLARIEPGM